MTTLERVKAEIRKVIDRERDFTSENAKAQALALFWVLELIDKYAEQEPTTRQSCDNCKQDRKECGNDDHYGFCQNWEYAEQEPCDDLISREALVDDFIEWREKLEYTVGEDYSGVYLLNVAIQKIWDMPSVTPKPTERDDVVSRQAVLDGIEELKKSPWATDKRGNGFEYLITEALDIVADLCVKQLPSVRPQEPKTRQFAEWVAREIFDDMWEYNKDAFAEIACRKLAKLGIVRAKGNEWELVEPQESEDK